MEFGYSPEKAERLKTRIDQRVASIEAHLRRIAEIVPAAGGITAKAEAARDEVRALASGLHDVVDSRVDRSAV